MKILGHARLAVAATNVTTLVNGAPPPAGTKRVVLQAEVDEFRFTGDGTTPTAIIGRRVIVNEEIAIDTDLDQIKLFGEAAGSIVNVVYYGEDV